MRDTVLSYSYIPMPDNPSGTSGECVYIETENREIKIWNHKILFNSEKDLYQHLRNIILIYKKGFLDCNDDRFQIGGMGSACFDIFAKKIKNDTLYFYDTQGKDKLIYIKLNSMGEFDLENAKDITSDIPKDLQCK